MTGTQYLSLKKLKGSGIVMRAAKHNLREIQAEKGADSHINSLHTPLNQVLAGPNTARGIVEYVADAMRGAKIGKLRTDAVQLIEVLVSLPVGSSVQPAKFFADSLEWVRGHFPCPVVSAVLHLDEAAPHLHVLLLPLVDGKMNGGRLFGSPRTLALMQRDFWEKIGKVNGLKTNSTGGRRMSKPLKDASARLVFETLKNSPELLEQANIKHTLTLLISANPIPILDALGLELPKRPPSLVEIMTKPAPESGDKNSNRLH